MKTSEEKKYTVLIAKRGVDACVGYYDSLEATLCQLDNHVKRMKMDKRYRKPIDYAVILRIITTTYGDNDLFYSRMWSEQTVMTVRK